MPDRVSDRVADDGSDGGRCGDSYRVDIEGMARRQQGGAYQRYLAGQRYAEAFEADDRPDDQIHRHRWDGLEEGIDIHAANHASRRRLSNRYALRRLRKTAGTFVFACNRGPWLLGSVADRPLCTCCDATVRGDGWAERKSAMR